MKLHRSVLPVCHLGGPLRWIAAFCVSGTILLVVHQWAAIVGRRTELRIPPPAAERCESEAGVLVRCRWLP